MVQSGDATALVVATGQTTEFGKLSLRIKLKAPETEFERGIRRFGYLLMEITLTLLCFFFAVNVYLEKAVSVVSAALIVFVVRSSKPFFSTRPGKYLVAATLTVVAITVTLPYTPIAPLIGFEPLPLRLLGLLGVILMLYISTAEIAKHIFYRLVKM